MLNLFFLLKQQFTNAIANFSNLELDFNIEPSKVANHGDFACNIAMIYAKHLQINPLELATKILPTIQHRYIAKLEIAGSGFINIFLHSEAYHQLLFDVVNSPWQYPDLGKQISVNLEYASPNPTGPMHVGHTRGAIYGDVLAKLLQKVGYKVLKEYYINDAGKQIDNLLESTYFRYLQACGNNVELLDHHYPGEYLIDIATKIKQQFGNNLNQINFTSPQIRDLVLGEMLGLIKADLAMLGIVHDNYFSEKKQLHDTNKINQIIDELTNKGFVYNGLLTMPKTAKGVGAQQPEDYDDQPQTLFRSSDFGDDQDRVVKKADGTITYFGADLAYIQNKFERGAKLMIMPLGADHLGYIKRLEAATAIITNKQAKIKVILCQMVKFVKDNTTLKMSKRAGNFITARQIIDEIGPDALRFLMLTRKNDAPFDFDLNKAIEQSKDNPIFYVQYAHTRCCSVLRNANNIDSNNIADLTLLQHPAEISLLKKIANFTRIIEAAATNFEPHRIAFYLQELSGEFHSWWQCGVADANLKFIIKNNQPLTNARLCLVLAVQKVISEGLAIFNITPLQEMY
jgi:arginyl-tRNA synthetase